MILGELFSYKTLSYAAAKTGPRRVCYIMERPRKTCIWRWVGGDGLGAGPWPAHIGGLLAW